MATLKWGNLLVETDFIEKLKDVALAVLTCATAPATMMVALVHHGSASDGRHETDAWIFLSADPNHDFDFHHFAMGSIIEYYMTGEGQPRRSVLWPLELSLIHISDPRDRG